MEFKSLSQLLYDWTDDTTKALLSSLDAKDNNATRELRKSIQFPVKILGNEFVMTLSMMDYWKWVDSGRPPTSGGGTGKLKESLIKWIRFKPKGQEIVSKWANDYKRLHPKSKRSLSKIKISQTKGLAYVIARNIHKRGFKGKRFYSSVVTEQYLKDFRSEVGRALKRDVHIDIKNFLNDKDKWQSQSGKT